MTPGIPIRGYYPPDNNELIAQIRAQDAAWMKLSFAISDVVLNLMLGPGRSGDPMEIAERLQKSIVGLMCAGSEKQVAMLEEAAKQDADASWNGLAQLCAERDQVQAQIDQLDRAKEAFGGIAGKMGSLGDPMSEMMEATVGIGIRQRLEQMNEYISKLQREMEAQ